MHANACVPTCVHILVCMICMVFAHACTLVCLYVYCKHFTSLKFLELGLVVTHDLRTEKAEAEDCCKLEIRLD